MPELAHPGSELHSPSILWVTPEVPDVSLGGGSVRQAEVLRRIGRLAPTDLIVAGHLNDGRVRSALRGVTEVGPIEPTAPGRTQLSQAGELLRVLLIERSTRGLSRRGHIAAELGDRAQQQAPGHSVVVAVHEILGSILPRDRDLPWMLHLHHVPSVRARQRAQIALSPLASMLFRLESANVRRLEEALVRAWDQTITVSHEDAAALSIPDGTSIVAPNGVDTERFKFSALPTACRVVFTGSMAYPPNVDGAQWLVKEIWPLVLAQIPEAELDLVGRAPDPTVTALAKAEGVAVHADVPDIVPWLERAQVAVVPLRVGTGTRLKALEALAVGRPVIGTALGLEGLGLRNGLNACVADDPDDFAEAIVRVLQDRRLASRLAVSGRTHVSEHYSWEVIVRDLFVGLTTRAAVRRRLTPGDRSL